MSDERAVRAAEAVQDWAETTVCIMSSRAEGIEHQAKLIAAEYADVLAELHAVNAKFHEVATRLPGSGNIDDKVDRLLTENERLASELAIAIRRIGRFEQQAAETERLKTESRDWQYDVVHLVGQVIDDQSCAPMFWNDRIRSWKHEAALWASARETITALEQQVAALRAEKERLRRCLLDGFDAQRVMEWMRSEPRPRPDSAFTSGGERQAAYLIEMAEDAIRQQAQKYYEAISETVVDRGRDVADLRQQVAALRVCLRELHAMVWGECPSLLDEDSGGSAHLDVRITAALSEAAIDAAKGE